MPTPEERPSLRSLDILPEHDAESDTWNVTDRRTGETAEGETFEDAYDALRRQQLGKP